jgi:hypothetical protein
MASKQSEEEREGEKRNKKTIDVKPNLTTIHVPSKDEKDTETHQII